MGRAKRPRRGPTSPPAERLRPRAGSWSRSRSPRRGRGAPARPPCRAPRATAPRAPPITSPGPTAPSRAREDDVPRLEHRVVRRPGEAYRGKEGKEQPDWTRSHHGPGQVGLLGSPGAASRSLGRRPETGTPVLSLGSRGDQGPERKRATSSRWGHRIARPSASTTPEPAPVVPIAATRWPRSDSAARAAASARSGGNAASSAPDARVASGSAPTARQTAVPGSNHRTASRSTLI